MFTRGCYMRLHKIFQYNNPKKKRKVNSLTQKAAGAQKQNDISFSKQICQRIEHLPR